MNLNLNKYKNSKKSGTYPVLILMLISNPKRPNFSLEFQIAGVKTWSNRWRYFKKNPKHIIHTSKSKIKNLILIIQVIIFLR